MLLILKHFFVIKEVQLFYLHNKLGIAVLFFYCIKYKLATNICNGYYAKTKETAGSYIEFSFCPHLIFQSLNTL